MENQMLMPCHITSLNDENNEASNKSERRRAQSRECMRNKRKSETAEERERRLKRDRELKRQKRMKRQLEDSDIQNRDANILHIESSPITFE
ncbi:hypothetical protein F8M41_016881 [Gigaspora margarita]|uniref:Uncharacterized protein n=1 Tax=Gigaspora margarita TaxID=4874 RepID=A0A8H4AP23_GIGMA|nr:hypothetical protein F8M41_016881 [Gigaspora margarita]